MDTEKRTKIYLSAAAMGFASTVLFLLTRLLDWPDFILGLSVGMMLGSLIFLLIRRLRDEFIEQLWNSGTTFAFVAIVIASVFAPLIVGIIEGFSKEAFTQASLSSWLGPLALLAFFIGFHIKWIRSYL